MVIISILQLFHKVDYRYILIQRRYMDIIDLLLYSISNYKHNRTDYHYKLQM